MVQIWRHKFKYICGILALLLCLLTGCTGITDKSADQTDIDIQQTSGQEEQNTEAEQNAETLEESGSYTSKEDVAAYIHQFGHLPDNFITKRKPRTPDGSAVRAICQKLRRARVSVGTDSAIMKEFCRKKRDGSITNVTLTVTEATGGQSGSFTQMTALCITRRITTKLLSFCMEGRIHEDSPGRVIYG